jgi:hypothetical protein
MKIRKLKNGKVILIVNISEFMLVTGYSVLFLYTIMIVGFIIPLHISSATSKTKIQLG